MRKNKLTKLFYTLAIFAFVSGCSSFGLYTQELHGFSQYSTNKEAYSDAIVLVVSSEQLFFTVGDEIKTAVKLKVLAVDSLGKVLYKPSLRTKSAVLYFLSPGYEITHYQFNQSLGQKSKQEFEFSYKKAANWSDYYFLSVKPFVLKYLQPNGYSITVEDNAILREWLTRAENLAITSQ